MIRFLLNLIEFFVLYIIHIKSIVEAVIVVQQEREYVTPENLHKYKEWIEREKRMMKRQINQRRPQKLPNEILNLIFNQVDKQALVACSRVSKRWKSLVLPILYKSVTPHKSLLSCLPLFAEIDKKQNLKHSHQISHFSPYFNLKHYGHYIKSLDLTKIANTVTDCTIQYISLYCLHLKSLNLSYCRHITNQSLLLLSRNQSIQHLTLKDCRQVSDTGVSSFHTLESLDLSRCHLSEKGMISAIVANGRTLRHISLNDTHVTFTLLQAIARHVGPRLESLSLSRTKVIQHREILYIVSHCPNLTRLDLASKNKKLSPFDEFIQLFHRHDMQSRLSPPVAQRYNELLQQHVSLRTVAYITDQLKHLTHLNLSNWHCLDDPALSIFASHPHLTCLNLIGCQAVTEKGIHENLYKKKMTIFFNNCKFTTDHYESDVSSSSSSSSSYCNY